MPCHAMPCHTMSSTSQIARYMTTMSTIISYAGDGEGICMFGASNVKQSNKVLGIRKAKMTEDR